MRRRVPSRPTLNDGPIRKREMLQCGRDYFFPLGNSQTLSQLVIFEKLIVRSTVARENCLRFLRSRKYTRGSCLFALLTGCAICGKRFLPNLHRPHTPMDCELRKIVNFNLYREEGSFLRQKVLKSRNQNR